MPSSSIFILQNNLSNRSSTFAKKPALRQNLKKWDEYLPDSNNKNQINKDSVNKTIEKNSEKSGFSADEIRENHNFSASLTNISENEKIDFNSQDNQLNDLDDLLSQLGDFKDHCTHFIKNFSRYTPLLYTVHAVHLLGQLLKGCVKEIKSVFSRMTEA